MADAHAQITRKAALVNLPTAPGVGKAIHIAQTPPMGPVFVSLPMDDMLVD